MREYHSSTCHIIILLLLPSDLNDRECIEKNNTLNLLNRTVVMCIILAINPEEKLHNKIIFDS